MRMNRHKSIPVLVLLAGVLFLTSCGGDEAEQPGGGVLDALARDKKARAGRVPLVLPTAIGRVEVHDDVTRAEVARALRVMAGREALL